MKPRTRLLILSCMAFLAIGSACSGLARGPVQVNQISPIEPAVRELVLLSQTHYVGDLAAELAPYGFSLRPLVRRGHGDVAATGGGAELALFEDARYGVQIDQRFDQNCAFTPHSIYHFTFTIVDIERNEVVLVVRQTGADGACTTVRPIWPTVAQAIADHWGPLDRP